jgi:hypothetical protein
MIPQRTNSFRFRKSTLHFSHADSTERGNFVKALRFAPTASAAPTSGGLDKAPLYAPVSTSSYGKNEEKKLVGTTARTTATPKSFILVYLNSVYTILPLRRKHPQKRRRAALCFEKWENRREKHAKPADFP